MVSGHTYDFGCVSLCGHMLSSLEGSGASCKRTRIPDAPVQCFCSSDVLVASVHASVSCKALQGNCSHCRTGSGGGSGLSPGAIAGIAVAGAVFALMLAAIAGALRQICTAPLLQALPRIWWSHLSTGIQRSAPEAGAIPTYGKWRLRLMVSACFCASARLPAVAAARQQAGVAPRLERRARGQRRQRQGRRQQGQLRAGPAGAAGGPSGCGC